MPHGSVGLCQQIRDITKVIMAISPYLREQGRKVCVVLTTDGESSDGDLIQALRPLQDLPVWLVVILFTASPDIISFWHNIDRQVSLAMDVISDIVTEATQVHETNPWLTYGVPLHQMRMLGASIRELDLLDERPLNINQMERVLKLVLPEECWAKITNKAEENFAGFVDEVDIIMKLHLKQSLASSSSSGTPIMTPTASLLPLSTISSTNTHAHSGSHRPSSTAPSSSCSCLSSPTNDFDALQVWDPNTAMVRPWIDVAKLAESFSLIRSPKSASCMIS